MTALTLEQVQAKAVSLYRAGAYGEALDFITQEIGRFPEEARNWRFFQASAAALTGNAPLAIQFLEQIMAEGQWVAEVTLRNPELKTLQGLTAFEEIVAISRQRHERAQSEARPGILTFEPAVGEKPNPLLLVCHGNWNNARSTAPAWMSAVNQGCLLAVAQSSQVAGPFDQYTWSDGSKATAEVIEHVADLLISDTIDAHQVILGGYSMGAGLCTRLALSGSVKAHGFIAVCPFFPDLEEVKRQINPSGLRGYFILGGQDRRCTESAKAVAEAMRLLGMPCEVEEHPEMGHAMPPDFKQSLARALRFIGVH